MQQNMIVNSSRLRPGLLVSIATGSLLIFCAGVMSQSRPMLTSGATSGLLASIMPNNSVENAASYAPTGLVGSSLAELTSTTPVISQPVIPTPPSVREKTQSADLLRFAEQFSAFPMTELREQLIEVGRGDTLLHLVSNQGGATRDEAHDAVEAMQDVWNPRKLRPGQTLTLVTHQVDGNKEFAGLFLRWKVAHDVLLYKNADGKFTAKLLDRPVERNIAYGGNANIRSSLFDAGHKAKVPTSVLANMIRLFSHDVDFQRDLKRGDGFSVLYERFEDVDGNIARSGEIVYASLKLRKKHHEIYYFKRAGEKKGQYYDRKGKSIKKALLKTPVDGFRISSSFGMRKHPVLGYSKMHKGIDFAAPTGTPIRAAGDGRVERAGWVGGYGKYVKIKHNGTFATAYAHASRIHPSIKPGVRVRQGQIIAYVGSTGRSTGPHLHYEVLKNKKHVNPRKMTISIGGGLQGKELTKFKAMVARYDKQIEAGKAETVSGVEGNKAL